MLFFVMYVLDKISPLHRYRYTAYYSDLLIVLTIGSILWSRKFLLFATTVLHSARIVLIGAAEVDYFQLAPCMSST